MGFYELSKEKRKQKVELIHSDMLSDLRNSSLLKTRKYFSDEDTYIRKAGYLSMGRIYLSEPGLKQKALALIFTLASDGGEKIRQTAVNAAGEIGMKDFAPVERVFDIALFDEHHIVRNAVIGSVKKMGNVNPGPVLKWAKKYLHHPDKEIRREICHGIELRGRTHPEDILDMLKELQYDQTARVRNTLVHVLGQISYKEGCLAIVTCHLKNWDNKEIINKGIEEIIDVHHRYRSFAVLTQKQAIEFINKKIKLQPRSR